MKTILLLIMLLAPVCALGAEGDPLLSVDDLLSLESSYDAFLDELEGFIIEKNNRVNMGYKDKR